MKEHDMDKRAFSAGLLAGITAASSFTVGVVPHRYYSSNFNLHTDLENIGLDFQNAIGRVVIDFDLPTPQSISSPSESKYVEKEIT